MRRNNISDMWARECLQSNASGPKDGIIIIPLTFCGVLEDLYKVIAKDWNNSTREKYDRDYNKIIIPNILNHNEKIISSYTKEDCENILDRIGEQGYITTEGRKDYSESQMNHFKYLIYVVFYYAAISGYCKDILWGSQFSLTKEREEIEIISKTQIKKSLSIKNEKSLIEIVMESPLEEGKVIAVLLMFALGVRDAEACGLDFGDIYELPNYKNCYVAEIKQTTIPHTCILQSSGKTWNSGRRIPIPLKVVNFIQERKEAVKGFIEKNNLSIDINRLPIAFDDSLFLDEANIEKRLSANKVTDAAREIFREIGIESETLATLEIEMEEKNIELEISEKTATAYLLRRNFATHLKILGLENADIQYLLGHCIEDPYINRPDYTESRLYMLSKQMSQRPLLNDEDDCIENIGKNSSKAFSDKKDIRILLDGDDDIKVTIYSKERGDNLQHNFKVIVFAFI